MSDTFDPYRVWLGIPRESRPPTHYELLGISANETENAVINAAVARQSAYVRNFQLGKHAADANRILNEIAAAKICLLDPVKRAKYDAELKARQPAPIRVAAPTAMAISPVARVPPPVDLDLLSAAAMPPPVPYQRRRTASLTLKPSKRKTSNITWQLAVGIGISVCVVLLAVALWPKPSQPPPPEAITSAPGARVEPDTPTLEAPAAQPQPKVDVAPPAPPPPPPLAVAPFSIVEARRHQERWAKYLGREVEETNSIDMKMVLIPPGEFMMGSPESELRHEADELQHRVRITKPFYVGAYEVTQEEYERVMGGNPSAWQAKNKAELRDHNVKRFPVDNVSWNDAVEFCSRLSSLSAERTSDRLYRLPTEAEWEYFCRAGTATPFWFGAELNGQAANCRGELPYGTFDTGPSLMRTTTVGSYFANPFNLFDTHGNVAEWVSDAYTADYYLTAPNNDPLGPIGDVGRRSLRGCSYPHEAAHHRSAKRWSEPPTHSSLALGFRVACELAGSRDLIGRADSGSVSDIKGLVSRRVQRVTRYRVLGPFASPDKRGVDRDYGAEGQLGAPDLNASFIGAAGKPCRWDIVEADDSYGFPAINQFKYAKEHDLPAEAVTNYFLVFADCDSDQDATLLLRSDDSCNLWVNGELVYTYRGLRGVDQVGDDNIDVRLRAGHNSIVAKVENYAGPGGIALSIAASGNVQLKSE